MQRPVKNTTIYDLAPIGLCVIEDGKRLYANPIFLKMLPSGLPEAAEKALKEKRDITALDIELPEKDNWGRLTLSR